MGKFLDIKGLNYFYEVLKQKVSVSESDVEYVFDNTRNDEELNSKVVSIKTMKYYTNRIYNYIDEKITEKVNEKFLWDKNIPH